MHKKLEIYFESIQMFNILSFPLKLKKNAVINYNHCSNRLKIELK